MSRIIKKPTITGEPVTLNRSFRQPDSSIKKEQAISSNSLDFSGFMKNEISLRKKKFSTKIDAHNNAYRKSIQKAYDEGYDKGLSDGAENECQNKIKAIESLLQEAKVKSENAIKNLEIKVIELSITMAERIIRRSIEVNPELILDIVKDSISNLIGSEKVILKVSPEDFRIIQDKYAKWVALAGGAKEFRIEIDKHLLQGDCLIETESGIIDSVVKERLDVFFEELLKKN